MADGDIARSIIVTGSSSGIGAALCRRLAAPGVGLVVHARHNRDGCEAVARQCEAKGAMTAIVIGDMAEPETSVDLVAAAAGAYGRLDAVVANAGLPIIKSFETGTREELDYAFASNLAGFFSLGHAALPHLRKVEGGRIVALGSLNAHAFRPGFVNFPLSGASKAGLVAMVKGLALEVAAHGITVNCVVPGLIAKDAGTRDGIDEETAARVRDHIPMQRLGRPDEVAATIEFLLSPGAAYITGETIAVGGGVMM
jgi:3-oxoacyl-[acyl-carrier protein] reductase